MALLRILAGPLLAVSLACALGPADREHRVKAVFLFNFAQFVVWPDSVFQDSTAPLVVGILGADPFNDYLDELVRGEKVADHPIQVKRFRRIEEVKGCHVLFISTSEAQRMDAILPALKQKRILTVGESEPFFAHGGMVNFFTQAGKIRLRINLGEVQESGLIVSAKLLRLADLSGPKRN
ncbi:MAG: YfiR family protein [Fibrobacteria bacterium]